MGLNQRTRADARYIEAHRSLGRLPFGAIKVKQRKAGPRVAVAFYVPVEGTPTRWRPAICISQVAEYLGLTIPQVRTHEARGDLKRVGSFEHLALFDMAAVITLRRRRESQDGDVYTPTTPRRRNMRFKPENRSHREPHRRVLKP